MAELERLTERIVRENSASCSLVGVFHSRLRSGSPSQCASGVRSAAASQPVSWPRDQRRGRVIRRDDALSFWERHEKELDEAVARARALRLQEQKCDVVRVTVERVRDLSDIPCAICLQTIRRRDYSALVPCLHRFCVGCIRAWFATRPTHLSCPLCNRVPEALLHTIISSVTYTLDRLDSGAVGTSLRLHPAPKHEVPLLTVRPPEREMATSSEDALVTAAASIALPRAMVYRASDGSIACSVGETNRLRRLLGMPALDGSRAKRQRAQESRGETLHEMETPSKKRSRTQDHA